MSVNSSSSSSLPYNSSSTNFYYFMRNCYNTTASTFMLNAFTIASILLILPLCIYVIYLDFQQWRQQRSGSTMSHSDIFTFHMIVMELINIIGSILFCSGVLNGLPEMMNVSLYLLPISLLGQLLIHSLTCVERYLAVVHPITYLGLRNGKGIKIRNISIGCVWLLCFAYIGLPLWGDITFNSIFSYCTLSFTFIVIFFCSLSVLYVLIGPGPGAGGEGRQRVDQSKMRVFHTIMAILGVLLLRFVGNVVNAALFSSPHLGESVKCGLSMSTLWFTLPSSLVLPLLFLHRAGKLLCCKNSNTSGQGSD